MRKFLLYTILALMAVGTPLVVFSQQQGVLNAPAAAPITIAINPPTVGIQTGASQNFSATLSNDILNKGAVWTLSGPGCSGSACGTLSPSFNISGSTQTISLSASSITYTAPASLPSPALISLTATSVQDNTKFATAVITLGGTPPPIIPQNVTSLTAQTATAKNTFPITSTVGNAIAVGVGVLTANTISSVQVCLQATPVTCVALTQKDTASNATSLNSLFVYTGIGISAGQGFIVVNTSGTPSGNVSVAYADITNASSFDTSAHLNNQSGTNPTGPALTPAVSNEYVLSFLTTTGTVSAVASPMVLSNGSAGFGFAESSAVLVNSSAVTPTYTATTGNWEAVTLALKPGGNSSAPISVALNPTAPTVQTNGTQSFTATVANDTANAGVNLTYVCTGCTGTQAGTGPATAASGVAFTYTAPAAVPGTGGSAITRIQHKAATAAAFPVTLPLAASVGGTGDLLCGVVHWGSPAGGTVVITDSAAQSYTDIMNGTNQGSFDMQCVFQGAAGVTSLTFSSAGSTARLLDIYAVEYTGINSLTPDKTASTFNAASITSMDSGFTASTTNTADLLFGTVENYSANNFTAGTDGHGDTYTKLDQEFFDGSATEDFFPTTATNTYKAIMTTDLAGHGWAAVAAFKGSAGGGAATTVQVTATSVTDPTKSASATVTIQTAAAPISVLVNPTSASLQISQTQAFTATISHDSGSNTVTWALFQNGVNCASLSSTICGSLSSTTTSSGTPTTYTAPTGATSGLTLVATDVTDTTKNASATIVVTAPVGPFTCNGGSCPAFSGSLGTASGGGAATVGGSGRNGTGTPTVIEVTNTNDSGSGSLRACVAASGPRTCIFRVAGIFNITSGDNQASNPFLTIDGQSAPGEVILGGPNSSGVALRISTHDVIVRYVTFSVDNFNQPSGPDTGTAGLTITNCSQPAGSITTYPYSPNTGCYNIITDHVTFRWSGNKSWITTSNFTPGGGNGTGDGPNHNITNQWFLMYEPHEGHPVGFGTATDESCIGTTSGPCLSPLEVNLDFHHGLLVNVDHRIPENSNKSSRWINIIVYNWGTYANQWLGAETIDVINNKFIQGNLNGGAQPHPVHFTQNSPELCGNPSVYVAGNVFGPVGTTTINSSQYSNIAVATNGENAQSETDPSPPGGFCPQASNTPGIPVPSAWQRTTPMAASNAFPIPVDATLNVDSVILSTVGNSQHVGCDGNPVTHRDAADSRIVSQYQSGGSGGYWPNGVTFTGQASIPAPSANWKDSPVVGFTVCTESLHDGIPDAWKSAHGLSTSDPTLWKTVDTKTGYTQLENYQNGLNP